MSQHEQPGRLPTKQECLQAAADVYGAILSDPDRAAELRAWRASQTTAGPDTTHSGECQDRRGKSA